MWTFALRLADLPLRDDWQFFEPSGLEEIWEECDPDRPLGSIGTCSNEEARQRVKAAFLGSVRGCMLGKPVEANASYEELKRAGIAAGEWPLRNYITENFLASFGRRHPSWGETVRENIKWVAPDDDINYTIMGMLLLEKSGIHFTAESVKNQWLQQLPIAATFGPERRMLYKAATTLMPKKHELRAPRFEEWVTVFNAGEEACGALIRADAYGYACPGNPALAAELAWRDASWTHRRTGIYGAMFVAAAIAAAQVLDDRSAVFETALQFVPRRSRFHSTVTESLLLVAQAADWQDGYDKVHERFGEYGFCCIHQEVGTLINTLRFARDIGDGICMQVMQGNDTDSFGATAGSILGAYFGPGHLDESWLEPFNDMIHVNLGSFYETSLTAVAERMADLPGRVRGDLEGLQ